MASKRHSFRVYFNGSFNFAFGPIPDPSKYRLTIREDSIGQARSFVFRKYTNISDFSISQNIETIPMRIF